MIGHLDQVNAVKFGQEFCDGRWSLLSGSADGDLCVWQSYSSGSPSEGWTLLSRFKAHGGAINVIVTLPDRQLFATGGSDATIKIWSLTAGGGQAAYIYAIDLKPKYIPLSMAFVSFMVQGGPTSLFIAVGGTRNSIQIYTVSDVAAEELTHSLQATMTGHESWITSVVLKGNGEYGLDINDDLWLASASQDKSVRLWRISHNHDHTDDSKPPAEGRLALEQSLSAKVHIIRAASVVLSITFEALLLGHEDWIYSASWNPRSGTRQLLTVSADNSLIIWEPEPSSGIWVISTRLGEISAQKGATSATGSTGGFWIGLWSPNADAIACLGKTGSWRLWQHDKGRSYWIPKTGLTGHTKVVTDLSWTDRGEYLLSTSSDQTTRLHAEWKSKSSASWHEFARPQIHGYDLNCVQSLSTTRFVSGADEKLLRVFHQPKNVAQMLERLCMISCSDETKDMPEAADIPVLGLSNKAIAQGTSDENNGDLKDGVADAPAATTYHIEEPPTEDHLARHTLWPEHEKLYGHGHEISALTANRSGSIIATACKASSTEHAVIRLYETKDWHEIRPSLTAHSLTIARLRFHVGNDQLLSVGRDRQWALFKRAELKSQGDLDRHASHNFSLLAANTKGHTRMILDAAWSNDTVPIFATAGRDKTVKIWAPCAEKSDDFACRTTITRAAPVTAIDIDNNLEKGLFCLAVGEDTGKLSYHIISGNPLEDGGCQRLELLESVEIEERLCPSKAVTRLAWRPAISRRERAGTPAELAVASADSSLRILSIDWQNRKAHSANTNN